MIILCSDLDNTLIYSHRRNLPEPKLPAEYLDGRVLSYMTERTLQYLSTQKKYLLIPVTTRTEAQYKRIFLFQEQIPCEYALVCNGAVLLHNGAVQQEWQEETFRLGDAGFAEIRRLMGILGEREHMYYVEPYMLYFVPEDPVSVTEMLLQIADPDKVIICVNGRKVYCLPKHLTKGTAVQRLRKYLDAEMLIAAGDGSMDIPMLNAADIALPAKEIAAKVTAGTVAVMGDILSDQICSFLAGHLSHSDDDY